MIMSFFMSGKSSLTPKSSFDAGSKTARRFGGIRLFVILASLSTKATLFFESKLRAPRWGVPKKKIAFVEEYMAPYSGFLALKMIACFN